MPLVTRTSVQGNVYKQSTEPPNWENGDLWIDTDNYNLYVNNGGTATQIGIGTLGSANQVQRVNSNATALEYATGKGIFTKVSRTTLGSAAAVISSSTFTAANEIFVIANLRASTGTHGARIRCGNAGIYDTGTNYTYNRWNAGTYETGTVQTAAITWPEGLVNQQVTIVLYIVNFANLAKVGTGSVTSSTPNTSTLGFVWNNTTNQITDIQFRADIDGGTGETFGAGSELEIYTRNFND